MTLRATQPGEPDHDRPANPAQPLATGPNKWGKLSGKWAVYGPGVCDFATVTATRSDGTAQQVDLGKVNGTIKGLPCAYPRETQTADSDGRRDLCAECGEPGYLIRDEEDGLRKHKRCCDIPNE